MGKKIDAFVLTAAVGAGFYLYYRSAIGSEALCVLLAFVSCVVVRRIFRSFCGRIQSLPHFRRRNIRRKTHGEIMRIACMDEGEALIQLSALLKKHYGNEIEAALIQAHPSQTLSSERIFDVWKANRGKKALAVCATCTADAECRAMAASLKEPKLALVDSNALSRLMTEHPEFIYADDDRPVPSRAKMRKLSLLLLNRKNAPKNLLFALTLGGMYLLTSGAVYLLCACALFLIAMISLRRAPVPDKLF